MLITSDADCYYHNDRCDCLMCAIHHVNHIIILFCTNVNIFVVSLAYPDGIGTAHYHMVLLLL